MSSVEAVPDRSEVRSPAVTVGFACLAMFVSYLPFSAVNGTLGAIAASTGAGTADLQWVTDAFALALAATVLPAGVLGDLFGRRRVTLAGLTLTLAGSVLGLVAGGHSVHLLWVAQALCGLGGGAVMSATLGLVSAVAPDEAGRQRYIAGWAAAVVVGLGGGPFLAGAITPWASWPWLFAPIAVLAAVVAAFGHRHSAEASAPAGRQLDPTGQAAVTIGVVALVFGVIRGGSGSWTDPVTLTALAVAVLGLLAFVLVEGRVSSPLLRLELFRSGGFSAAGVAAGCVLFSLVGAVFVLSLLFAHQGASELEIAERIGCLFAANAAASLAAARAQAAFGARIVVLLGLVIAAAGMATLISTDATAGFADYSWRLVVAGAGSGLVMATCSALAVQSVSGPLAGMAGAANNALRQLGAALGSAVLGGVLASRLHAGVGYPAAVHTCVAVLATLLLVAALTCAVLFTTTERN